MEKEEEYKGKWGEAFDKLGELGRLTEAMEEVNEGLGQGIDKFVGDANSMVTKKHPGEKLSNMLELWQKDIQDQCWSRDELEHYSVFTSLFNPIV